MPYKLDRTRSLSLRGRRSISVAVLLALVAATLSVGLSRADEPAHVTQDVPASDAPGQRVALDSLAAFSVEGGNAIFEPGSDIEEVFSYSGVDANASELVGVSRTDPSSHAAGSVVAAVADPDRAPSAAPSTTPEAAPEPSSSPDASVAPQPDASSSDENAAATSQIRDDVEAAAASPRNACVPEVVEPGECLPLEGDELCSTLRTTLTCGDPVDPVDPCTVRGVEVCSGLPQVPPPGDVSDGGECNFMFGHHQEPILVTWTEQVWDAVNCSNASPWSIQYMEVHAVLEAYGTALAPEDEWECSSAGPIRDCAAGEAKSPKPIPFCCVPSGLLLTNHGTWTVTLGWGLEWDRLPWFCSGEGTDTASCDRQGYYFSGNPADAASAGADAAIAIFGPVGG